MKQVTALGVAVFTLAVVRHSRLLKMKRPLLLTRICRGPEHAREHERASRVPDRRRAKAGRMPAVRVPRSDKMHGRMLARVGRLPGSPGARAGGGLAEWFNSRSAGVP